MHFRSPKILAILTASTALTACGGGSDDDQATAQVSVGLTDAAVDYATEVNVVVTSLVFQPTEGDRTRFELEEPLALNLLDLEGGAVQQLVTDAELAAGEYNWIRLELGDSSEFSVVEEVGGGQYPLKVPSGEQRGLQTSSFVLPANGTVAFTIDFDVRKSLVYRPGPDEYLLKPVLRLVDNAEVGSVSGTIDNTLVSTACADANTFAGAVYLHAGSDVTPDDLGSDNEPVVVASVNSDAGIYGYTAAFLPAGDYTASYTCDVDVTEDDAGDPVDEELTFQNSLNVTVVAGETTTANF